MRAALSRTVSNSLLRLPAALSATHPAAKAVRKRVLQLFPTRRRSHSATAAAAATATAAAGVSPGGRMRARRPSSGSARGCACTTTQLCWRQQPMPTTSARCLSSTLGSSSQTSEKGGGGPGGTWVPRDVGHG